MLNYILDFYCFDLKLAIELDGRGHEAPGQDLYDIRRDCELSKLGIHVVRIKNEDVRKNATAPHDRLIAEIQTLIRPSATFSRSRGRRR